MLIDYCGRVCSPKSKDPFPSLTLSPRLHGVHDSPPQFSCVKWPDWFKYCNKEHLKNLFCYLSIHERSIDFDKKHFPSHVQFAKGHFKEAAHQGALTKNQLKESERDVNS